MSDLSDLPSVESADDEGRLGLCRIFADEGVTDIECITRSECREQALILGGDFTWTLSGNCDQSAE